MRILLTNDDGIDSPALAQLRRVLSPFRARDHDCARPETRAASSQSLTLHRPLRIQGPRRKDEYKRRRHADRLRARGVPRRARRARPTSSSPASTTARNMGEDVFYSGTVAARDRGACSRAWPAVAASLVTREAHGLPGRRRTPSGRILRQVLARGPHPPHAAQHQRAVSGRSARSGVWRVTRLGNARLRGHARPQGRPAPAATTSGSEARIRLWRPDEGTDFHTVDAGYVSVTPLQLELTDHGLRADMAEWGLTL